MIYRQHGTWISLGATRYLLPITQGDHGSVYRFTPEFTLSQGGGTLRRRALQFRGFRRELELSWALDATATKYVVSGVTTTTTTLPLSVVLPILLAAGEVTVKPFGAGQQPPWTARTYATPFELSDIKKICHTNLKLILTETTLLQSIPVSLAASYDPELYYGQHPPSQAALDGYWDYDYADPDYVESAP